MTETRQQPFGPSDYPGNRPRGNDWWARRPRRSRTDSKIAGVAGGLGRHLGVDPILFRVGFVAFTLLGGAGVLAYCLLWLLLPADGDDVSAGESLIGRGRSSVSPVLAVGLALLVIISISSSFAWGLPFWPVAIAVMVALHIAYKRRRGPWRPGSDWQQRMTYTGEALRTNSWPEDDWHGQRQGSWSQPNRGHRGGWGWGCAPHGSQGPAAAPKAGTSEPTLKPDDGTSPFSAPAFWESKPPSPSPGAGPASTPEAAAPFSSQYGMNVPGAYPASAPADPAGRFPTMTSDAGTASVAPSTRTTPPAWDPLGAAPFAWDLPDIDLAPKQTATVARRTASPVIGRAAVGLMFIATAVEVLGIMLGWWSMAWAAIGGTALAIIAVGVLLQALRGRTLTLVGPGVALSVLTVALAFTGLAGAPTVGTRSWVPTSAAAVQSEYLLSTGEAVLDLSNLHLTEGQQVSTAVEVGAGQARVVLPAGTNLDVTCSSNAGEVDCGGLIQHGLGNEQHLVDENPSYDGTLHLDVHVGTGEVEVARAVAR